MILQKNFQQHFAFYLIKWVFICTIIGLLAGSASAFFLISLEWLTNYREANLWIVAALPLAGFIIGWVYHRYGESVVKGNNQLIEEILKPSKVIPLKMAPLVLWGTLMTHLFGGSAGREGTAVQMAGAIADQFNFLFNFKPRDRKIILIVGISAGFASVFGTPLAGAVFALEVFLVGRMRYDALVPSFLVAVIASYTTHLWGAKHTIYDIGNIPEFSPEFILYAIFAGVCFGLGSILFSKLMHVFSNLFKNNISYPPLRPFVGGIIVAAFVFITGSNKFIGLGIPTIEASFSENLPAYDFLIKIILTTLTLSAGFKGGEVTPLFFIGATLGNALSYFVPLPIGLLAGMGFVALFAGATNTPLACILMGIELFGADVGIYVAIACVIAYLTSGHNGIYSAQIIGTPKHLIKGRDKGKKLEEL